MARQGPGKGPANLSPAIKSLEDFFKGQPPVLLAFLFGSMAADQMRPESDVDIGILFKKVPNYKTVSSLGDKISTLLKKEIDPVVLNNSSPIINMQILKKGLLIHARDRKIYHRFFSDTLNQYDDLKRIRKNCEENILRGRIYAG
jgi:predicted nucleotidyltransferase